MKRPRCPECEGRDNVNTYERDGVVKAWCRDCHIGWTVDTRPAVIEPGVMAEPKVETAK